MASAAPDVSGTVLEDIAPELTRTYADAFLNAAQSQGGADAAVDELQELIEDVWRARPEFAQLLSSPSVPAHRKDEILEQAFEGRAMPVVSNFLRVLNRHGRMDLLPAIAAAARARLDVRHGRKRATVRTAVPLDDGQVGAIRDRLRSMLAGEPVVRLEVDPSLIGGLVVQVGDDVFDASVATQLDRLRRRLIEEKSHELQERREAFHHAD